MAQGLECVSQSIVLSAYKNNPDSSKPLADVFSFFPWGTVPCQWEAAAALQSLLENAGGTWEVTLYLFMCLYGLQSPEAWQDWFDQHVAAWQAD